MNNLPWWPLTLLYSSLCVSLQLYFVHWDMSRCLRALTETLEEHSFVANDIQVREPGTSVALFVLPLLYRFPCATHVSPPLKINRHIILDAVQRGYSFQGWRHMS